MLEIPIDLSWSIMHYKEKHDDLIVSDIDEMRKRTPPQNDPGKSVICTFVPKTFILNDSFYSCYFQMETIKH